MNITIKSGAIVIGVILAVVGIFIDNWKLAATGNTIALVGLLFS